MKQVAKQQVSFELQKLNLDIVRLTFLPCICVRAAVCT